MNICRLDTSTRNTWRAYSQYRKCIPKRRSFGWSCC